MTDEPDERQEPRLSGKTLATAHNEGRVRLYDPEAVERYVEADESAVLLVGRPSGHDR